MRRALSALSPNLVGILCVCLGIGIFSVQDLILKLLSGAYPLSEAMVLRSMTAVPCLLIITWAMDGGLRSLVSRTWPAMLLRGLLNFLAYLCYYLALAALPMPTTVALYFTAPLVIVILSVLVLGEVVSPRRWGLVGLGFLGVLLMVRPGTDVFDWAALLPVMCGALYAASMTMARVLGTRDTAAAMAFWGNLAFLGAGLALAAAFGTGWAAASDGHASMGYLLRGWVWPTARDALLLCLCGPIAAIGLTLLTQAYRVAQNSVVAPFEFTFAFWGLLWGWLVWGDLPDGLGWVGIAVIIGAGVLVLRDDRGGKPA